MEVAIPEYIKNSFGKVLERLCRLQKLQPIIAPGQAVLNESCVDPRNLEWLPNGKRGSQEIGGRHVTFLPADFQNVGVLKQGYKNDVIVEQLASGGKFLVAIQSA